MIKQSPKIYLYELLLILCIQAFSSCQVNQLCIADQSSSGWEKLEISQHYLAAVSKTNAAETNMVNLQEKALFQPKPQLPVISEKNVIRRVKEKPLKANNTTALTKEKFAVTAAKHPALKKAKVVSGQNNEQPDKPKRNRQVVALALAYLFGSLGVHRFYLGYYDIGAIQLGLSLTGYGALFGFVLLLSTSMAMEVLLGIFLTGILCIVIVEIWRIVDLIRIGMNTLKPKDAEYEELI